MTQAQTYERDESYQGTGRVWARAWGGTGKHRFLSNVPKLSIKQKLKVVKVADATRRGGGNRTISERIDSITAAFTIAELSGENLGLCVGDAGTTVAAATVASEPVTLFKGAPVELLHLPDSITSVVIAGQGGATLTAGTDYEKSAAGLYIPSTSSINDTGSGVAALVTYESLEYQEMQAGALLSVDLELLIEGLNDINGRPLVMNVWKLHVPMVDELMVISDGITNVTYEAELLRDATKGEGASGFYRSRFGTLA